MFKEQERKRLKLMYYCKNRCAAALAGYRAAIFFNTTPERRNLMSRRSIFDMALSKVFPLLTPLVQVLIFLRMRSSLRFRLLMALKVLLSSAVKSQMIR